MSDRSTSKTSTTSNGPIVRFTDLERPSTAQAIVSELTQQILSGSIPAGTRLREVELSEGFGVSRQSLRAALMEMAHEGLLRREMHRGFWVPELTEDDLRDVYKVRAMFEAEAARYLATDPALLGPVRDAMSPFYEIPPDASWGRTMEVHLLFHRAIVDAVGSPRLSQAYGAIWSEAWLGLVASGENHEMGTPAGQAESHTLLLQALESADPDRAADAARDHMMSGLNAALAHVDPQR